MMDLIQYLWLIIYLSALMALFTYGMNCWFLMLMYRLNYPKAAQNHQQVKDRFYQNVPSRQWPRVTIQLPIYNERYVVERLIESVCRIDYPKNLLEVQVLDDSTDDTVQIARAMVTKMKTAGVDIVYVHRADRSGFKAGALKEGLKTAKGSLVAVFDADFIPEPDFLMESVPYFQDSQVGMLQTRWGHINSDYSLLTRAQSIGIDGHFGVEQASRSWSGFFMNFNGTAGVWRKKTIEDAGGWQAPGPVKRVETDVCIAGGLSGRNSRNDQCL
jgi:cellulose synthase/poly-beta-1,6-N-acetylglucosamine synthase-like glycosyltransferase